MVKKIIRKIINIIKLDRFFNWIKYIRAHEACDIPFEIADVELKRLAPMPESSAITKNKINEPKYDLTIIVPAYNAENWIRECLDSILQQDTNYKYIIKVVDDGSTDNTGNIIASYLPDERLQVIHQANRGHAGARNVALKEINSRYIMFVDSDDKLLPGAIEVLLYEAYKEYSDIVEGNGYCFNETGRMSLVKSNKTKGKKFFSENLWGGPWLKVIKSTLFEDIEFPEGFLYEDTIISTLLYPRAISIVTIPNEIYAYRIHASSITQNHTNNLNRVHSYWIMILMHENMKQLGISTDYESYRRTMRHIVFTYRRMVLLPEDVKKYVFVCTREFLLQNYGDYLDKKDEYRNLSRAFQKNDYGKYSVYCRLY